MKIKGRHSKYLNSLENNDYWKQVKVEIHLRDGHSCRNCGTEYSLNVHHITYYANGKSIVGFELQHLNCLVTVCEKCHKAIHADLQHKWNPNNKFKELITNN